MYCTLKSPSNLNKALFLKGGKAWYPYIPMSIVKLAYPPGNYRTLEDEFPFLQVGYVSSLEGIAT